MKTTVTALTSILLALALSGTAIGTLPEIELPEETVPMGGLNGQAIGCSLEGDGGFVFGYGKPGVPSSTGFGDGECEYNGSDEHSGEVTHSVLKVTGDYGYSTAYGGSFFTGYARAYTYCGDAAEVLIDWTGEEPEATYLSGGDCTITRSGDLEFTDVEWYNYGGGRGGDVKFVHTDNLVDALVHLLL